MYAACHTGGRKNETYMKKLIRETLMNPRTGEWSRKNLTALTCLIFSMVYSLTGSIWSDGTVHEFVVIAFLGTSTGMLGMSVWEKKNLTRLETKTNE